MKVLRVITRLPPGGIERRLVAVLPMLRERGVWVEVCCIHKRGELADELERLGIRVHFLPIGSRLDPRGIRRLAALMRAGDFHLVHSHMYRSNVPATIAARLAGRPILAQVHNVDTWETRRQAWMDRALMRWRAGMIAVSERVARDIERRLHVPPERVHVLYNGVDLARFAPSGERRRGARAALGLAEGEIALVCPARLHRQKNHAGLLRAFREADFGGRPVRLLLAGEGPEGEALRALAAELGVAGVSGPTRATFLGHRDDMDSVYAAADVAVLPSFKEGFSNAIIEAMAAGLPVIASDVGGNSEAIAGTNAGIILQGFRSEELAAAMARLATDDAARAAMGAAARARAAAFSLEAMADRTVALYRRVVSGRREGAEPVLSERIAVPAPPTMTAPFAAHEGRRSRSGEHARGGKPWQAIALAGLLAVAPALLGAHYVGRWRANNPPRLAGHDTQLGLGARTTLEETARALRETRRRDAPAVLAAYRAALRDAPWSPGIWLQIGTLVLEEGATAEAIAHFDVARRIDPLNAALRYALGNELFFAAGAEAALADHRAALDLDLTGARGAYFAHLAAGADPVELARTLIPPRPALQEMYFRDAVVRTDLAHGRALWEWLATSLAREASAGTRPWPLASSVWLERLMTGGERAAAVACRADALAACYRDRDEDATADGLTLGGGGLFNPQFRLPFRQVGRGDWRLAPDQHGLRTMIAAEPRLDARSVPGAPASAGALVPAWLALRFSGFANVPLSRPEQEIWLAGPATHVLVFEAVTERLYSNNPFFVEVRVPTAGAGPVHYPSAPLEGNRAVRTFELTFHVPDAEPAPQLVRVRRNAGRATDPPLSGALYLRFVELRTLPLDPAHAIRAVPAAEFQRAIDAPQPSPIE